MKQSSLFGTVLIVLVLILCVITIMLAIENQGLKDKSDAKVYAEEEQVSVINSAASPIIIRNFENVEKELSFDNQQVPTILFVFTTTCSHCEHSVISWKSIAVILDSSDCRIVGLSLDAVDATRNYVVTNDVRFNVVSLADSSMKESYHIRNVPQTFIISDGGIITHVWSGRFDLKQIEDVVNVIRKSEDGGS